MLMMMMMMMMILGVVLLMILHVVVPFVDMPPSHNQRILSAPVWVVRSLVCLGRLQNRLRWGLLGPFLWIVCLLDP